MNVDGGSGETPLSDTVTGAAQVFPDVGRQFITSVQFESKSFRLTVPPPVTEIVFGVVDRERQVRGRPA